MSRPTPRDTSWFERLASEQETESPATLEERET